MRKYEFTGETKDVRVYIKNEEGRIKPVIQMLHQIRSLQLFICRGTVIPEGAIGGWIENEDSLSQFDSSWLWVDSMLCNGATASGETLIVDSTLNGNIEVINSMVANSKVECQKEYDETNYLINTVVLDCELNYMVHLDVNGGKLKELYVDGESGGKIITEGNIELINLYDPRLCLKGEATFENCYIYRFLEGNHVSGTFKDVKFVNQVVLDGTFEMEKCRIDNVLFTEGETYQMQDVNLKSKSASTLSKSATWENVMLQAELLNIMSPTNFKNLYAFGISTFAVFVEAKINHVFLDKKSSLYLDGDETCMLIGEPVKSKNKTEKQGIRIYSKDLNLHDSSLSGNVNIVGNWSLLNTNLSGCASLYAYNEFTHIVENSFLSEFSSVRVEETNRIERFDEVYASSDMSICR